MSVEMKKKMPRTHQDSTENFDVSVNKLLLQLHVEALQSSVKLN